MKAYLTVFILNFFIFTGPKLDWDPDIVAALDSDNDEPMDADLEDDFIELANQEGDDDEEDFHLGDGKAELDDRRRQWLAEQMQMSRLAE